MVKLGAQPDVAQVVLAVMKGTHNGIGWANKLHLQYSGTAPSVANLTSIGTSIGSAWNTNFAPMCHANVTMDEVDLQDLTSRLAAASTVTGLGHVGSRAGTDLPNSVACVVSWKINKRFRGGHPRSYIPAGVTADITSGHLWTTGPGSFVSDMTSAAAAFLTALNAIAVGGATYKMAAVNMYTHDPATGAPMYVLPIPNVYTIQSAAVHDRIDTQRRRLGKEVA